MDFCVVFACCCWWYSVEFKVPFNVLENSMILSFFPSFCAERCRCASTWVIYVMAVVIAAAAAATTSTANPVQRYTRVCLYMYANVEKNWYPQSKCCNCHYHSMLLWKKKIIKKLRCNKFTFFFKLCVCLCVCFTPQISKLNKK